MRDQIKETIATRAWARWTVLAIVSFTMMAGYVVAKEMSPLQFMLEKATADGGMGWTSGEFGIFAGSRGFFNVFLLMLFVGGIILDKMGVRFTGILSCVLMLAGSAAVYGAITYTSPDPMWSVPVLGTVKRQVVLAALGFAFFGIGYEMCGITVSKAIVRWFSGKEMALAMGLQVAMARLGTALALGFSPIIALNWGLPRPILIGVFCVGVGLIAYLYYCTMDRRLDKDKGVETQNLASQDDEKFHFSDMKLTVKNPGFWLITLLCLFYYSALYPFLDFATKLMISKYGVDSHLAGLIPAILPFTSIVLTPLFGGWCDKKGRGATMMVIGSVMLTLVLIVFAMPLKSSWIAVTLMCILGIAFSLLPAALWPAVPKIVPMKQLGTSYSIIYYIQNIGLMLIPVLIGKVLERNTVGDQVDYTYSLIIFAIIGLGAIVTASLLLWMDRKRHYGLEDPNINS
ncbi:MAG: major facilitator superfamily domain-containing protein 1 [Bacteroidales bacterium]|nr:major facilitator superfamily domain-containing protein 1 [Bacteroidales bacterium]